MILKDVWFMVYEILEKKPWKLNSIEVGLISRLADFDAQNWVKSQLYITFDIILKVEIALFSQL